jgi:hypothetical protein
MAISVDSLLQSIRGKSIHSMRAICFETSRSLAPDQALELARRLLSNPDVHGAMASALISGHVSYLLPEALEFLRTEVPKNADVRVQDCLARGFDHFCLNRGYDRALVTMEEWAKDPNDAVRRAVVEAPRVWTRKDYFKSRPKMAIAFVASMKADSSGTVRFSVGRALAEMGEDFPELLMAELKTWNMHYPPVKHTYTFASKNLHTDMTSSIFQKVER